MGRTTARWRKIDGERYTLLNSSTDRGLLENQAKGFRDIGIRTRIIEKNTNLPYTTRGRHYVSNRPSIIYGWLLYGLTSDMPKLNNYWGI